MANARHVGKMTRIAGAVGLACAIGAVILAVRSRADSTAPVPSATAPEVRPSPVAKVQMIEPPRDVRSDTDPVGDLRIEGQVVTDDMAPVAGAVVTITTVPRRTVTTEADGAFAFDRLPPRQFGLIASSSQGVAGPVPARPRASRDPVILKLRAAGAIEVVVVRGSDRKPIAGATVSATGLVTVQSTTDGDGRARLTGVPPGPYQVAASAPELAPASADVFLSGPGVKRQVELRLVRGAPITGRVLADAKPVAGAVVTIADDFGVERRDPKGPVTTKPDGTFALAAVPRGTFRITATAEMLAPEEVSITADGITPRSGVDIALVPGARLVGKVVTPEGTAVSGALVRIGRADSVASGRATRQVVTGRDGRFAIAGLPAGDQLVAATGEHASSAPAPVKLRAGAETELTLKLERTGRIAGIVVDRSDAPMENAMVRVWRDPHDASPAPEAALWGFPIELTDFAGHFEVTGLAPGRYILEAAPPGAMPRKRVSRRTWSATTDQGELRLVVDQDGSLRGRVAYEDGSTPDRFTVRAASTDVRGGGNLGEFELADVPPGSITVTVEGPGFATRTLFDVAVKSGKPTDTGTITVVRGSGRRLAGHVTTADGKPVAEAVVRAGRMLVGDGTSSSAVFAPTGNSAPRDTTTDETGAFALYGVAKGDIAIVAEHDTLGRSATITLRTGDESVTDLGLVILPFGGIEGVVLQDGQPAPKVIVQATPTASPEAMFGVITDANGHFRFDRLAPHDYRVAAIVGSPETGFGQRSKIVTVTSQQIMPVTIDIGTTGVTVEVHVSARNAAATGLVFIDAIAADIAPKTGRDLKLAMTTLGNADNHQSMSLGGAPARLANLAPGAFTLCGMAYPIEVKEMTEVMDYLTREGDRMAVSCVPLQVAPLSGLQTVELAVDVPAYVPPPKDPQAP